MDIKKDYALKEHNTFGIDAHCDWFITYDSVDDLSTLASDEYFQECKFLHIGEGSNLLFLSNFRGIVLSSAIDTIEIVERRDYNNEVDILVGSGTSWDSFVEFAVEHNFWGIENMSLIPGTVGAAAVQNIGAYGSELMDTIKKVYFFDFYNKKDKIYNHLECKYDYRNSIFKNYDEMKIAIHHVLFTLKTKGIPNISYPDLKNYFECSIADISLRDIREAVIDIRKRKLPDTKEVGNAGSFFMNPIVSTSIFEKIKSEYPDIPYYTLSDNKVKIPAGWLIDQCGLKGIVDGKVGTYDKQALVIINRGGATGKEIGNFAEKIKEAVKDKFAIEIYPEVRYIL